MYQSIKKLRLGAHFHLFIVAIMRLINVNKRTTFFSSSDDLI
jgi:hypothetical protein